VPLAHDERHMRQFNNKSTALWSRAQVAVAHQRNLS
jgi:hypothetical protein